MGASRSHKGSHFWFLLVPLGSISVPFRFLLVPFRFLLVPSGSISVPFGSIWFLLVPRSPLYDKILISYAQNEQKNIKKQNYTGVVCIIKPPSVNN